MQLWYYILLYSPYTLLLLWVRTAGLRWWCCVVAYVIGVVVGNEEEGSKGKGRDCCTRSYFLRCTVHQTQSCWKYKSSDSFFFAYTYCRYIVFSSTITYLVVHKYTYNASRPHKSTIRLRFTWHLPLDIDIWEELYITKYALWWDSW